MRMILINYQSGGAAFYQESKKQTFVILIAVRGRKAIVIKVNFGMCNIVLMLTVEV